MSVQGMKTAPTRGIRTTSVANNKSAGIMCFVPVQKTKSLKNTGFAGYERT
jgi:hypothetical protein